MEGGRGCIFKKNCVGNNATVRICRSCLYHKELLVLEEVKTSGLDAVDGLFLKSFMMNSLCISRHLLFLS